MGDRQQMAALAQQQMASQGQQQLPPTMSQQQGGIGMSPEYVQQLIALANPGGILRAGQQPQGDPSGQQFLLGATNAPMPTRSAFTSQGRTGYTTEAAGRSGVRQVPTFGPVFDETGYLKAIDQWEKAKYGRV